VRVCIAFIIVIFSAELARGPVCCLWVTGTLLVTEYALDVSTPGGTEDGAVFTRDSIVGDSATTKRARGRLGVRCRHD
jgi:hypothetical protein